MDKSNRPVNSRFWVRVPMVALVYGSIMAMHDIVDIGNVGSTPTCTARGPSSSKEERRAQR